MERRIGREDKVKNAEGHGCEVYTGGIKTPEESIGRKGDDVRSTAGEEQSGKS